MSESALWAKASPPEHEEELASLRAATLRDKHDYLEARFQPHHCDSCGHRLLVCKTSMRHTSIQWTAEAAGGCPELAGRSDGSGQPVAGCAKLAASIEEAARDGRIALPGGSGP
ncbi:MAG: hypothetical protein GEU98_01115 [Pseudonocardiaceae bacterium]|nr:hypothetical protein [Pseudonocardiaceae bacterium]